MQAGYQFNRDVSEAYCEVWINSKVLQFTLKPSLNVFDVLCVPRTVQTSNYGPGVYGGCLANTVNMKSHSQEKLKTIYQDFLGSIFLVCHVATCVTGRVKLYTIRAANRIEILMRAGTFQATLQGL